MIRKIVGFCFFVIIISGCTSGNKHHVRYMEPYTQGETATLKDGKAIPPKNAPQKVITAIQAANKIVGKPYKNGGGHGNFDDDGYDCSGTASYVLHAIGALDSALDSKKFLEFGEPGAGKWITVYARAGHVFLVIAGLRLDTTLDGDSEEGPIWTDKERSVKDTVMRHPKDL